MLTFCRETATLFDVVENWYTEIPIPSGNPGLHTQVMSRFLQVIRSGQQEELVAQGTEGIRGVMLANGIMLSSFERRTVETPIDGDAFVVRLQELIAQSTGEKAVIEGNVLSTSRNHSTNRSDLSGRS